MMNHLSEEINVLLNTLSFREREIIKLRYGVGGGADGCIYTLEEVGRIFKVTRERVRAIEAKAIHKLYYPARARGLGSVADDIEFLKTLGIQRPQTPVAPESRCVVCDDSLPRPNAILCGKPECERLRGRHRSKKSNERIRIKNGKANKLCDLCDVAISAGKGEKTHITLVHGGGKEVTL